MPSRSMPLPPERLPSRLPAPMPSRSMPLPPERLPSRMEPTKEIRLTTLPLPERTQTYLRQWLSRIETQPWPRPRPPRLPANNSLSNSDQWDLELSRNIGLLLSESQSPSLPSQLLPSSMVVGRVKLHSLRARIDPATATSNQFRCLNFPN